MPFCSTRWKVEYILVCSSREYVTNHVTAHETVFPFSLLNYCLRPCKFNNKCIIFFREDNPVTCYCSRCLPHWLLLTTHQASPHLRLHRCPPGTKWPTSFPSLQSQRICTLQMEQSGKTISYPIQFQGLKVVYEDGVNVGKCSVYCILTTL